MRSMIVENASGSASTGVMSLNTIPGSGKSGTSRIRALIASTSTGYLRLRLAGGLRLLLGRGRDCPPVLAVARLAAALEATLGVAATTSPSVMAPEAPTFAARREVDPALAPARTALRASI